MSNRRLLDRIFARVSALVAATAFSFTLGAASAQTPQGIIGPGFAAVSGFSGLIGPTSIAPGVDPADQTVIDPNGWSMRVMDLTNPGGPPQAQLIAAPKSFSTTAAQTGQLFGLALDNATPPNIYAGATSIYGLPIIASDTGVRLKTGMPTAVFMTALFGPNAGPGSIWRIDGRTGEVRLFANLPTNNSGPALGGLAFDSGSGSLFAVDRETGLIFSYGLDGQERGRFDHGVTGRQGSGLPPVAFDPAGKLDITKPVFDTQNPGTWGYAARERLVFGLGVNDGRLYYGVAEGLQVWSVSIAPNGTFGADPRLEITVQPGDGPTEISKIVFDGQGRMILGERASPSGSYDFTALAQEGVGRVLRYARTPQGAWAPAPDEYAIGFPLNLRNGNGGVAIGYDYLPDGRLNFGSCGGYLWSTGEQLRVSPDPAIAQRLRALGPEVVNGLQGNGLDLVRPKNVPPFTTYFADYDDRFDNPYARGHMGDIVIPVACSPRGGFGFGELFGGGWVEGFVLPPGPTCRPGEPCSCQPGQVCCPPFHVPGPNGVCRSLCQNPRTELAANELCYRGVVPPANVPKAPNDKRPPLAGSSNLALDVATTACWDGSRPIVGDGFRCPRPPGAMCPMGYEMQPASHRIGDIWTDFTCERTPPQRNCDQQSTNGARLWANRDGQCRPSCQNGFTFEAQQCCPPGAVPGLNGACGCADGRPLVRGQCPPPCPPGQTWREAHGRIPGQCRPTPCPNGKPMRDGQCPPPCKPGLTLDRETGQCQPTTCPDGRPMVNGQCAPTCKPGLTLDRQTGQCNPTVCPTGQIMTGQGCTPPPGVPVCPPGLVWSVAGCGPPPIVCPRSEILLPNGTCGRPPKTVCPVNTTPRADGMCCPAPGVRLTTGNACVPAQQQGSTPPPPTPVPAGPVCASGFATASGGQCCRQDQLTTGGVCCPTNQSVSRNGRACIATKPPKRERHVVPTAPQTSVTLPPPPHLQPPPHFKPPKYQPPRRRVPPIVIDPPVYRPPVHIGPIYNGPRFQPNFTPITPNPGLGRGRFGGGYPGGGGSFGGGGFHPSFGGSSRFQ